MAFFGANGFATKAIKKIKSQQQDTSNPGHTHSDNNNNEDNNTKSKEEDNTNDIEEKVTMMPRKQWRVTWL